MKKFDIISDSDFSNINCYLCSDKLRVVMDKMKIIIEKGIIDIDGVDFELLKEEMNSVKAR